MQKNAITPSLNNIIVKAAQKACIEANCFSKKAFNKAYDEAIKKAGFSPPYFKKVLRAIGAEE